ncbi:MAG: peptide-methionine (R)-S-oxide reductase MsrB [Candidatus Saccharimonadales bacterium]
MSQTLTDNEWKEKLSPEQYAVLRQKATEQPFSGTLLHNKDTGIYTCAACQATLFSSNTKFDSGSGWPSFYEAENDTSIKLVEDNLFGMHRTEVVCANCDSHLGHLFQDAPEQPTGQRFCINSVSLSFTPKDDK